MSDILFADTPIERMSIKDMSEQQINALVEIMQERRMRQHSVYKAAQEMKREAKYEKDVATLEKRLAQMQKLFISVDNGLEKLKKYSAEVSVLRMAMED